MSEKQSTAEQAAYERGFRDGWEVRGKLPVAPLLPTPPLWPTPPALACPICGLTGINGFVCNHPECPTMPRCL